MKKFKEKTREENKSFAAENNINGEIGTQSVSQTIQIDTKDKKSDLQKLCEAVEEGKLELVKELLEQGVNADEPDEYNNTPLHYAISEGHFVIINLLLKHVAKLDLKDNDGFTPLHRAASRNYQFVVSKLLEKGAEIIGDEDDGNTPLHYAASENNLELVQTILENYQGTKDIVNEVNNFGWSIMHSAAHGITHKRVDWTIIEYLLQKGAKSNLKSERGLTARDVFFRTDYSYAAHYDELVKKWESRPQHLVKPKEKF